MTLGTNENAIELIYKYARVGIAQLSTGGKLIRFNPMAAEIWGYSPDELRTQTLSELLPSYVPGMFMSLTDMPIELLGRHKNGHTIQLSFRSTRPHGSDEIILVIEDVTERKKAESLLRQQKQVLELVARNLPLNDVLGAIVKLIEDQSPGTRSTIYLVKDGKLHLGAAPSWPESFVITVDGCSIGPESGSCGAAAFLKRRVVSPDITDPNDTCWGQFREWILSYGIRAAWSTPVLSKTNETLGTVSMCLREARPPTQRDFELVDVATKLMALAIEREQNERLLTEQKAQILAANRTRQLETQLEFSERLASLGRLAAGIAHEINNPLAHICGSLELAKIRGQLSAECAALIDGAGQSAIRIAKIVESLKSFSRNDSSRVTPVQLEPAIESTLLMAQNQIRQTATLKREFKDTKALLANEGRLTQVFLNLIVNAVQSFSAADISRDTITVSTGTKSNGDYYVTIEDNGSGMELK